MRSQLSYITASSLIFFFQAEDGIRDRDVTGVQTCALPIWSADHAGRFDALLAQPLSQALQEPRRPLRSLVAQGKLQHRSEERRVGKECRGGWGGSGLKRIRVGRARMCVS